MSVSKVQFDGNDLINLESDTVTAAHLESGYTAHDASGAVITGSLTPGITPSGTVSITTNGTHDVTNYASAAVNVPAPSPTLQSKSVTYTSNGSATVTPDAGYDGLSSVDVTVNVSGGGAEPTPSTVTMSANGGDLYYIKYMSSPMPYQTETGNVLDGDSKTISNMIAFGIALNNYGNISVSPANNVKRLLKGNGTGTYDYYHVYGDCTVTAYVECFLPDTLISLADGTKKQIKDLTYSDILRVWDFDAGTYGTAGICWLTRSGMKNGHYYKLTFSDGTVLKTTGKNSNHKVYNVDERYFKGVNVTEIGDRIFSENGIVTVTNKEYIEEEVEYYNLITTQKIDCFAEGILTSDRYGNLYPIDDNMMYIKDGREIRPYSEFEAVGISRYWYDTLRLGEVTGTVEETRAYIDKLECQMLPLPEEENE